MIFLSPIWLAALAPWAALTAWLLRGRRRRVRVPFLQLWRGPVPLEVQRRGWSAPPLWIACAIIAMLAAILGAARPALRVTGRSTGELTIIIDRGLDMSALHGGLPRFRLAAAELCDFLAAHHGSAARLNVIDAAGSDEPLDVQGLRRALSNWPPTALDTREPLRAAVREQLAMSSHAVVVLSDQDLGASEDRLIQVVPPAAEKNIAIQQFAARGAPTPQVMLGIRNESDRSRATVRITSGNARVEQTIDLPPKDAERNYFFSLRTLGSEIAAELIEHDDQPADDRAWLVREDSHPRIELRVSASPELRRMIDAYTQQRPPDPGSQAVAIVGTEAQGSNAPAAIVASGTRTIDLRGDTSVADHPITARVNWNALPADLRISTAPSGNAWTPLVTWAGQTLIAARSQPARQVWVGFESSTWPRTSDFVIFWANVFDWLGTGEERYAAHPLSDFDPDWKLLTPPNISPAPQPGTWPGIYQTPDRRHVALDAFAQPTAKPTIAPPPWRPRLAAVLTHDPHSGIPLQAPLLLLCLCCAAIASLTWERPASPAKRRA